jgi:hypothetical protein
MNTTSNDDLDMWAHRDQGVAAYLIATGARLLLIADLDTPQPLFVFAEPTQSLVMEHAVTNYKLHALHQYNHRRPHRVHGRAMACADQQLDALVATGRAQGLEQVDAHQEILWIWMPDTEELELADGEPVDFR